MKDTEKTGTLEDYGRRAEFAQTLKYIRKQQNLTQGQLGAQLGYGYTVISCFETGRIEPTIHDLIKLSDFFGVSIDYMVGHRPKRENERDFYIYRQAEELKRVMAETQQKIDTVLNG